MMPNMFCNQLVERDRISKGTTGGMRRGREKTNIRGMSSINIRMGDSAKYCEVLAMLA